MQILTTALWRIATPVEAGAIHPISFPHSVSVTLASTLSALSGRSSVDLMLRRSFAKPVIRGSHCEAESD
jgi:hypothetical protein